MQDFSYSSPRLVVAVLDPLSRGGDALDELEPYWPPTQSVCKEPSGQV